MKKLICKIVLFFSWLILLGCTGNSSLSVIHASLEGLEFTVYDSKSDKKILFSDASYFYKLKVVDASNAKISNFLSRKSFFKVDNNRLHEFEKIVLSQLDNEVELKTTYELYVGSYKLKSICESSPCTFYWMYNPKDLNDHIYFRVVTF